MIGGFGGRKYKVFRMHASSHSHEGGFHTFQYLPFPQNLLRGKELNPCPRPISYARQVQISISSYKHHKEKNASHLALYYYKFCKSLHFLGTLSSMIAFMYALSIIFISPLLSDLK